MRYKHYLWFKNYEIDMTAFTQLGYGYKSNTDTHYDSPTEAYRAAIIYTLKNLI